MMLLCILAVLAASISPTLTAPAPETTRTCRKLPGDSDWPSDASWDSLNRTVGGRLIKGVPVAQSCYGPQADEITCSTLQNNWGLVNPFLSDPVNVVSPYFGNNSCNPFVGLANNSLSSCELGNMASYAINVSNAETAVAGIKFARENNIRLVVKNTGHDYLGGSAGKGALALWTHNLKEVTIMTNYSSSVYSGPAVKIGAGVQFVDLYNITAKNGLRVVGGSCPTVGAAGGWRLNGGHGPLASSYGLGADNSLEFEVVTVDGKKLTASPQENSDLYWALSGGGAGTYAVVISAIVKAHKDGPVAGSTLTFPNIYGNSFWVAVEAWMKHLLVLDTIPGFASEALITKDTFSIVIATLPNGTETTMKEALAPFYQTLSQLNITAVINETAVQKNYLEHYDTYIGEGTPFTRNLTVGGRLIPRSLVHDTSRLSQLTETFRDIVASENTVLYLLGYNVSNKRVGLPTGFNSVTPAWRDSLFLINIATPASNDAGWSTMSSDMSLMNRWQDKLRTLTPGGGAYINEGTYNDPQWKIDYFGGTYDRLRTIKRKYDPEFVLYVHPGVGSDEYEEQPDGHLCKV
ncbi:uncharacterized protein TRUGW13939_09504 [Talaromyces rugulosus]|uniref:FAD-binding PCMH-type domain-containing protein n=1 Tax=Talaromyces rugulosus TaxID=121627 RepID=A0A7H8RA07_TALRU|nr:uncharacterized protein TRUGW13939_09504 [Talaromyces rugulosus]QKX62345.1 hypothetical protein TRUGW13939_09504 [Talaromyces rugulosus]